MHALVIEDNFLIATQIEDGLSVLGYETFDLVDTESAAIDATRIRCPDLITADDRLASGTGLAAVHAICAEQVIPVVFILGSALTPAHMLPYASVIGKPFGGLCLRDAVGQAIVRAAKARHVRAQTHSPPEGDSGCESYG